jgi:hypothetical protein
MPSGTNGGPVQAGGKEFDRLFGGANPNPDRIGCPSSDVLRALATKQRPIGDPSYEHLTQCSPCYREFRQFQTATARPGHRKAYFATAAAVFVVFLGVGWYLVTDNDGHSQPAEARTTKPEAPITAKLLTADLRHASPTRGSRSASQATSVKLSRDLVQLTVVLPIGAEPGRYDIRLVREPGEVVLAAAAPASIVNFATTLSVTLDLRAIEPAVYVLKLGRAGEHPDSYTVKVE